MIVFERRCGFYLTLPGPQSALPLSTLTSSDNLAQLPLLCDHLFEKSELDVKEHTAVLLRN
jgi:hypothetical protein